MLDGQFISASTDKKLTAPVYSVVNESSIEDYERLIQKLEGDIRSHIRVEAQLKLHIESMAQCSEEKNEKALKSQALLN